MQWGEVYQTIQTFSLGIIDNSGGICHFAAMHKAVADCGWLILTHVMEQLLEGILQAMRFIITDMRIVKIAPAAIAQKQAGFEAG